MKTSRRYKPVVFRRGCPPGPQAQYVVPGHEWRYLSRPKRKQMYDRIQQWLRDQITFMRIGRTR